MFFPIRSDTGAVLPFEQLPAVAGTYESGMMLTIANTGKLALCNGVPQFLCVSNATVKDGELITVAPVRTDEVYRCDNIQLDADQEPFVGAVAEISYGVMLQGEGTVGNFLVTAVLADGSVEGRFIM